MQAFVFAVIAYGYVASAVCVLIGPVFIPWFIVPKLDWLFWGWLKAFIGFCFYQAVASAFIFVFSQVVVGIFRVIGTLSISNIVTLLPALFTLVFVCIYGLHKIPACRTVAYPRDGCSSRKALPPNRLHLRRVPELRHSWRRQPYWR